MAVNAHSSALVVLANDGYDPNHARAFYSELRRSGFTVKFAVARKGDCHSDLSDDLDDEGRDEEDHGAETKAAHTPEGKDEAVMGLTDSALPLSAFKPSNFAAVLFCGGSGCASTTFSGSEHIQRAVREFWESGKVVASVGSGALAFEHVTLSNGKDFLVGRTVAAPCVQEEEVEAAASPQRSSCGSDAGSESSESMSDGSGSASPSESSVDGGSTRERLVRSGAVVECGKLGSTTVSISGRLVSGQNTASALKTARFVSKVCAFARN